MAEIDRQARDLLCKGYVAAGDAMLNQVEGMKTQHAKLREAASQRENELADMLKKIETFENSLNQLHATIERAGHEVEGQSPVGGDVDKLKQLMKELRVRLMRQVKCTPNQQFQYYCFISFPLCSINLVC